MFEVFAEWGNRTQDVSNILGVSQWPACQVLRVPQKQPKRGRLWLNDGSCVRRPLEHRHHVCSCNFVMDRTHECRAFRMLTVID